MLAGKGLESAALWEELFNGQKLPLVEEQKEADRWKSGLLMNRGIRMEQSLRIGAFCKKFGVSASTIRYYIHRGILIPETRNGQYLFPESCIQDMREIMELKDLRFSLEEIHSLLTLRRKFNLAQKADADSYLHLLHRQRERLTEQLEKARQQEALLEQIRRDLIPSSSGQ